MPIVATVTKASSSQFFAQEPGVNVGSSGGVAFTLRKADGTNLGSYQSASQAMATFAQFHGPNRIYKWQQRNLAGDIEQHVCIGTPLDPSEIWVLGPPGQAPNAQPPTSLIEWIEPAAVPGSVNIVDVSTGVIRLIKDLSGSSNVISAEATPNLVEGNLSFNSRPVVNLVGGDSEGFSGFTVRSPPWTIVMVAINLDPGGDPVTLLEIDGGGASIFRLGTDGANLWEANVGGTTVKGTASDSTSILTAKANGTNVVYRVNGVDEGTIAANPESGVLKIGGFDAAFPFTGRFAFLMISDIADADNTRVLQMERYCRERFQ